MAQATAVAYGSRSKIGWVHVRNSKKEKDQNLPPDQCHYYVHDWPEVGEGHHLCDAYQMALQIAKLDFHMETLAEIRQSTRPVIEGGKIQYEVDPKLVAEWDNAEDALTLGGVVDWPYRHNERGERIELRVRDRTSAALTIKALQSVDPERWARPEEINVNKRAIKAVLTLGERKQPPQQDSPLRRDLVQRLAELRAKGPQNPKPSGPVPIMKADPTDPPEKISSPMSDDAAKPLPPEPPRALPPPRRDPQEPVSYARPSQCLDQQDRRGPPASGGFSITRNNKST